METKSFPLTEVKAVEDADQPGTFEAVVAVFGNVDRGGDRIVKGAFARTLSEKGLPPIVWSHNWDVPPIGTTLSASETDEGLHLKGRLFVNEAAGEDSPVARQVWTAMKAQDGNGASPLKEFSFGYETRDSADVTEDGKDIRDLKDIELFEAGPTLVGMNPATRLLGVKALHAAAQELEQTKSAEEQDPSAKDNPDPNDAPRGV